MSHSRKRPHRGWKLSEQQKADVVSRYQAGESMILLAKAFSVSRDAIAGILKRRKVALRTLSESVKLGMAPFVHQDGLTRGERRYKVRTQAGRCPTCGAQSAEGKRVVCPRCRETQRTLRADRRRRCVCQLCGAESGGRSACDSCQAVQAASLRRLKVATFEAYGGVRCACCGETELVFLALDHVNGGGNKHRKSGGSGSKLYRSLRRQGFPSGYQVLCANCNFARHVLGVCPHQANRT